MHIWRENNLQTAKAAKQFGKGKEKMGEYKEKYGKLLASSSSAAQDSRGFSYALKWPNKSQTSLSLQFLSCQSKCQFDVRI